MTTKKVKDFLDRELFVKRDIVTFRSLSRELGIHVKDAKNELQVYCDAVRDTDMPVVPTYLVSGEVPALTVSSPPPTQLSESTMDVESGFEENQDRMDVVHRTKVLLVDARTLDEARSIFSRIHTVHIYSLSLSRFGDAGLVCTQSCKVLEADAKGGLKSFSAVGKITGPHVKLRAGAVHQSVASSSKTTLDVSAKLEAQISIGKIPSSGTKGQVSTTPQKKFESEDRPKPSGKLDWSKAKTKGKDSIAEKTREERKPKVESNSPVIASNVHKRGTKRKPSRDTDLECESASASESSSAKAKPITAASSFVKKEVVSSDDDEGGAVRMLGQRRPKKKSAMTSDPEMSLRAMMDIDDDHVDCASGASNALLRREEEEESEEERNEPEKEATAPPVTTEDEESDHVPVVSKRRKPRKVAPLGSNGLKKRRVIKSRTTTDAKGYMQTEDYSSYESVEEEEEETKPKPKLKGKEKKNAPEPVDKDEEVKPKVVGHDQGGGKSKAKPLKSRGGAPKRGGLLNFFGPERGKK